VIYLVAASAIVTACSKKPANQQTAAGAIDTSTLSAEFLRGHQADLTRLQNMREGRPAVTVTP